MIGDILVRDDGADIIIMDDIEDFLLLNYQKAGRTTLKLSSHPLSDLRIPEIRTAMISDTVASLRLDNIVSSVFKMSRSKAAEAIRTGLVFVNSSQAEKPDMKVEEGDKLVLRGKGKAYLREVGGQTRKDRTYIVAERYLVASAVIAAQTLRKFYLCCETCRRAYTPTALPTRRI